MSKLSLCINCRSSNTQIKRPGEHFIKICDDCGYKWGPFVSENTTDSNISETTDDNDKTITLFDDIENDTDDDQQTDLSLWE